MPEATDPPPLIAGLPGIVRQPVLVTGGTGTIGSEVVRELLRSGVPARVLTRTPGSAMDGADEVVGDLATGAGLTDALADVQAVVHCASNPTHTHDVDIEGTRRLCRAIAEQNPAARLIHVSIVGCWDNPLPYYRAKAAAETVVTSSGLTHVVARATQIHELVHRIVHGQVGGVGLGMRGLRFAPIESRWLGAQLVDLALEETPAAAQREYAGPDVLSARDLAILTAHIEGRKAPHQLRLPAVGGIMRRLAEGSNLPGPEAVRGGCTYAQWLSERAD